MEFSGRTAIVTGGESGIGKACAEALGLAGADVALTYFSDRAAGQAVVDTIVQGGGRALAQQADVGREDAVEALYAAAEAEFGRPVSLLVNSAGLNMQDIPVAQMTLDRFDLVVRADLYGPFLTCRRFVRGLGAAGKGRIVNVSSIHERAPRAGGVEYDSAKGGLSQLTATLALELAPRGIAVNGIAPGMILTPMNQSAVDDPAELARKSAAIPWGRAGTAAEVAALIVFLLSGTADYITGTTVTIDGGLSLTVALGA